MSEMMITRIGSVRNAANNKTDRIVIEIGDDEYVLNERFGELHIHLSTGHIAISPGCANEITLHNSDER